MQLCIKIRSSGVWEKKKTVWLHGQRSNDVISQVGISINYYRELFRVLSRTDVGTQASQSQNQISLNLINKVLY